MKKAITCLLVLIFLRTFCITTRAAEEPELIRVTATYYDIDGVTASGTHTRPGIMAAKSEWMGMTAILYAIQPDGMPGEIIGYYEILDTGEGHNGAIRKGRVVDIWSQEPINTQKCYLQLVKADG